RVARWVWSSSPVTSMSCAAPGKSVPDWQECKRRAVPGDVYSPASFDFGPVRMFQLATLIVALFCALAGGRALAAENLDAAGLAAAVEKARAEHIDTLAPRTFAQAAQASQNALKEAE